MEEARGGLFRIVVTEVGFVRNLFQNQFFQIAGSIITAYINPLAAAAFSAAVAYANGGGFGDALLAAGVTYGSIYAAGQIADKFGHQVGFLSSDHVAKVVAHGVVGGTASVLRGGKFQSGFAANAFTAFAAPGIGELGGGKAFEVAAAAAVGGAGAELGGGKFANGGISGAFQYLYNDVALACRGTAGGMATHCGLFVFQGKDYKTAKIDRQFSLGGNQTRFNTIPSTNDTDLKAFRSGSIVYPVDPPSGVSQRDFDALVIRNGGAYRADFYNFPGSNSNTAVGVVIHQSGGIVPEVPGAYGLHCNCNDILRYMPAF